MPDMANTLATKADTLGRAICGASEREKKQCVRPPNAKHRPSPSTCASSARHRSTATGPSHSIGIDGSHDGSRTNGVPRGSPPASAAGALARLGADVDSSGEAHAHARSGRYAALQRPNHRGVFLGEEFAPCLPTVVLALINSLYRDEHGECDLFTSSEAAQLFSAGVSASTPITVESCNLSGNVDIDRVQSLNAENMLEFNSVITVERRLRSTCSQAQAATFLPILARARRESAWAVVIISGVKTYSIYSSRMKMRMLTTMPISVPASILPNSVPAKYNTRDNAAGAVVRMINRPKFHPLFLLFCMRPRVLIQDEEAQVDEAILVFLTLPLTLILPPYAD
ncbi:hypothetical protein DFH11DRAFT_1729498 [Phellopilus nigrolimitatus]|nr:hypothetical protein DFH11DRAFT_1729498 [Phellopilus nigrolimitatus]